MLVDKPLTRRDLLKAGGTAAAVASLPGLITAMPALGAPSWWARSTYTGRIGQAFVMRGDSGSGIGLKLVSVDDLAGGGFALVFKPSSTVVQRQATRRFAHAELGSTDLFVVPLKPPGSTLTYVVIVNRV
jgi:hypothetical protein